MKSRIKKHQLFISLLTKTNRRKGKAVLNMPYADSGLASIPTMILFGGIIIEIAIASAFLVFFLNNSLYGTKLGNEALAAAQSGIDDAILQVILDKNCPDASCPSDYTLTVNGRTAEIEICKDCAGSNTHKISSTGKALTRRKKIVAILDTNPTTGKISISSIKEE